MFEKGDYVVYGQNGVCQVEGITCLDMEGIDKEREYYILSPVNSTTSTMYCPLDNDRIVLRRILTSEEAWKLIDEIPEIEQLGVINEKLRESEYKQSMRTCDSKEWIRIIKTLYLRKRERLAQGKKITTTDERYLKMAEDNLYSELSIAIGKEKSEMEDVITERVNLLSEINAES
ncbi:MAG: CarD family transcriptional regulator [Clostridiales bacterium]|nr:CarD family transcriptional regulator [Clostridiales bacterium]